MFRASRGFTLLELVVVLALLALATALVAPSGFRMIASWRRAADMDAALEALSAQGTSAAREGRAHLLDAGPVADELVPGLPENWHVELAVPLQVQANGACSDSHGMLRGPDGYEQPFQMQAPFCRTRRSEATR